MLDHFYKATEPEALRGNNGYPCEGEVSLIQATNAHLSQRLSGKQQS